MPATLNLGAVIRQAQDDDLEGVLEYLLLNHLTSAQPDLEWRGCSVPTDRNAPAAGMYDSAGFRQDDGSGQLWTLASDAARPERPAWFD